MLARPQGLFNFSPPPEGLIPWTIPRQPPPSRIAGLRPPKSRIAGPPLLQLDRATILFGGLTAVNAVDLTVGPGELVGLIGPNGAGKTTVFNLITGVYQPTDGTVAFGGRKTWPA